MGEDLAEEIEKLEPSQVPHIIELIVDKLIDIKAIWINSREERIRQITKRVVDGQEWWKFDEEGEKGAQGGMSRASKNFKSLPLEVRGEIITRVNQFEVTDSPVIYIDTEPEVIDHSEEVLEAVVEEHAITGEAVVNQQILKRFKNILTRLYGSAFMADYSDFTNEEATLLFNNVFNILATYPDARLKNNLQEKRAAIEQFIYEGKSLTEISKEKGLSESWLSASITTLSTALSKFNKPTDASAALPNDQVLNDEEHFVEPKVQSSTAISSSESITHNNGENTQKTEDAIADLTSFLRYKEEYIPTVREIFDPSRSQPKLTEEGKDIYGDLGLMLLSIRESKRYFQFVNTLEFRILYAIAAGAKDGSPLGAQSVQKQFGSELAKEKRKFSEVTTTGIRKFMAIRQEMLVH